MKNQVLNDEYITKKIRWFNEKYHESVPYLGFNPNDIESVYRIYDGDREGSATVRRTNELYFATIYTNESIPRGTMKLGL